MQYKSTIVRIVAVAGLISLSVPVYAEGKGLKIGDAVLHLGGALQTGYDTNIQYQPNAQPDMFIDIRPQLKLDFLSSMLLLNINGYADIIRYLGVVNTDTRKLSDVEGEAFVNAVINPQGKLNFQLRDEYMHMSDPRPDIIGTYRRNYNDALASLVYKPGGDALSLNVFYKFTFDLYETLPSASYYSQQPGLDIRWKFFPKTAFVIKFDTAIYRYTDPQLIDPQTKAIYYNIGINGIKAMTGITGLITSKFSTTLLLGYGNTLAESGNKNFNSLIADVDFRYDFSPVTSINAGYKRTFDPASLYIYMGEDIGYITYKQLFIRKLELAFDGTVRGLYYGAPVAPIPNNATPSRYDILIDVRVQLKYNIKDWVSIALFDAYEIRDSNSKLLYITSTGSYTRYNNNYTKNITMLVVDFMY